MNYKELSTAKRKEKIQHYFRKTLSTRDDLEAMMMYARNLTEVLTNDLMINNRLKPFTIREDTNYQGKLKKRKVSKSNYQKIKELDSNEIIPTSIAICLRAIAAAGNVSVHSNEILDESLNSPFRELFAYICSWYYETILKKSAPKFVDLIPDRLKEWEEIESENHKIDFSGKGHYLNHKSFSISFIAWYQNNIHGQTVDSNYKISCTYLTKDFSSPLNSGTNFEIESGDLKLIIHVNEIIPSVYSQYGKNTGKGQIVFNHRIFRLVPIEKSSKPSPKKKK